MRMSNIGSHDFCRISNGKLHFPGFEAFPKTSLQNSLKGRQLALVRF